VNESVADFAPSLTRANTISFGLAAVRNVGSALVERIVAERTARGPFSTIYDFVRRVDIGVLNKRTMESLIKAGAFDCLDVPRQGLTLRVDELIDRTIERRRDMDAGISTLFAAAAGGDDDWGGTEIEISPHEFDKATRLAFEREMLGLYVSDHPLLGIESQLARLTDGTIADARERADEVGDRGDFFTVGGVLSEVQLRTSKRGETFARVVVEDMGGSLEVFVFAKAFASAGAMLERDRVVVMRGRIEKRDEEVRFTAQNVTQPEFVTGEEVLRIRLAATQLTAEGIRDLKAILAANRGPTSVIVETNGAGKSFRLTNEYTVDARSAVAELRRAFGPDVVAR
jgi:DNA polymerase-3 subunit alpha